MSIFQKRPLFLQNCARYRSHVIDIIEEQKTFFLIENG